MSAKFKLTKAALLGLAIAGAFAAAPVYSATINVNTTTDVIADDGSCSLREAVIAANTNAASGASGGECVAGEAAAADTIAVPAGTYTLTIAGLDETAGAISDPLNPSTPVITADATKGDLDIIESVNLVGAGSGQTVIEWTAPGSDRIFHVNAAATINVAFSGMTLRNGKTLQVELGVGPASSFGPNPTKYYLRRAGGAVAIGPGAAVVLVDPNKIGSDNSSGRGGSQKPGNPGEDDVGEISLNAAMTDVIVESNNAEGDGGGIYTGGPLAATNVIVRNNVALTNGGGVYNEGNSSFVNSTVSGNQAEGGGGFFGTGSNTVTITGTTFSGNQGVGGGGISGRAKATLKLTNSTLSGNIGTDLGGGLHTNGKAELKFVTLVNSLSGSDAPTGGSGINTFGGAAAVSLQDSIIANNKKGYVAGDPAAVLLPANCGATGSSASAITSLGNNISDDASCPTAPGDLASTNPKIGPLENYGGLTQTHALLSGSPAINAGVAIAGITTDQRGVVRDAKPDIGAYEVPNSSTSTSTSSTSTSSGGGGCTIGGDGRPDPTLIGLLFAALAAFGLRRRDRNSRNPSAERRPNDAT